MDGRKLADRASSSAQDFRKPNQPNQPNQPYRPRAAARAQLDQATQQNAALVQESAAAAESLEQQALRLVDAVAVFQVG